MNTRNKTTFDNLKDDDLDDHLAKLAHGTILREEYNRLARWLLGAIDALGEDRDSALVILAELSGMVTFSQQNLLIYAFHKHAGLVQTVTSDESYAYNFHNVRARQLSFDDLMKPV